MKSNYKWVVVLFSIVSTAICTLPIMSTCLTEDFGYRDIFYVHGYNLMEFSAWGCVPLFATLLIPVILYGSQARAIKELELILLFSGNMICYVHSFNAARAWLLSIGGSPISFYPGVLLYPCCFVLLLILGKLLESRDRLFNEYGGNL